MSRGGTGRDRASLGLGPGGSPRGLGRKHSATDCGLSTAGTAGAGRGGPTWGARRTQRTMTRLTRRVQSGPSGSVPGRGQGHKRAAALPRPARGEGEHLRARLQPGRRAPPDLYSARRTYKARLCCVTGIGDTSLCSHTRRRCARSRRVGLDRADDEDEQHPDEPPTPLIQPRLNPPNKEK